MGVGRWNTEAGDPRGGWPEPFMQAEGLAECTRCGQRYHRSRGRGHGVHCPDCRDVLRSDAALRMALSRAAKTGRSTP